MPNVRGLSRALAAQQLDAAGFCVAYTQAYSDSVPEGDVIDFAPEGSAVPVGATVTVCVSLGPEA